MYFKFFIILLGFAMSSCSGEEFQIGESVPFGQSLVYLNGQSGNYVNSSYSVVTSDSTSVFSLQFAETKEYYYLTTAVACRINKIPISDSYYFPVDFKNSSQETIYVSMGEVIEWDLPGQTYIYASGSKDYVYFEQIDSVEHIMLVRGKLTFKRFSDYSKSHGQIPIVIDFAIYDYYKAF